MIGVLLDILKTFDKVWHDGLIFKLKSYTVDGQLLLLRKSYLHNREQRLVLNWQISEWKIIFSGVLEESVLDTLLFLIYISHLADEITSTCKAFADNISPF